MTLDANSGTSVVDTTNHACATCGQVVAGGEFHSFDSCVIHRLEQGHVLTPQMRRYICHRAELAMRDRIARKDTS